MAPRSRARLIFAFCLIVVFAGIAAWLWWYPTPAKGPLHLSPVRFADLKGWADDDLTLALPAFARSCAAVLKKPLSEADATGYGGTPADWAPICQSIPRNPSKENARRWFESNFMPFAIKAGETTDALFTGYYEPQLRGSRVRHGAYQTPIYALPSDLIDVDLGLFRPIFRDEKIVGRVIGNRLVPYATRGEIDSDGLAHAATLFFADDPIAVFFLHIQGSGRIVLENDAIERVAYAGQNGWPYTPIGRVLVQEGALPKEGLSMQVLRAWMKAHPREAKSLMERDLSYVFFKEAPLGDPSLGSPGAEGVPLAPGRSLAIDRRFNPLGAPFFVVAKTPDPDPARPDHAFARLLIGQDTGGAIRGPLRGDLFFGYGKDAEAVAGRMKAEGKLYVLLPKALAQKMAGAQS